MKLLARWWHALIHIVFTPWMEEPSQIPLPALDRSYPLPSQIPVSASSYPKFSPPSSGPDDDYHNDFFCEYPSLVGWEPCYETNRSCWLRNPKTGEEYNIHTNYEVKAPLGITRNYYLEINNKTINADGYFMREGKVFNDTYPGPWLRACWGDSWKITVKNNLEIPNGTTIHWHGIRQFKSFEMDGVNGVTQCPITQGDQYTYSFTTMQYGSTWYHSHYSLQYGDGMLGPLTIFGPSSAVYDEAKDPFLLSDWGHRSAFQEFYQELGAPPYPGAPPPENLPSSNSFLLNGRGRYECTEEERRSGDCIDSPPLKHYNVKKGKKYLLRLINTSVDSTFVFSIDNHILTVVSADFVPIYPYSNNSVLIGIGQRYHVIIEANPKPYEDGGELPSDNNYWIRMTPAEGCTRFVDQKKLSDEVAILRYNASSTRDPTSKIGKFSHKCADEDYWRLVPVLPWQIGRPANEQSFLEAGLQLPPKNKNEELPHGGFVRWALGETSMWLDSTDPTIMNYAQQDPTKFPAERVVIPQDYGDDDFVYVIITATGTPYRQSLKGYVPAAHPIHLHGHDFALLEQSDKPYWERFLNLKLDNPPRRDVALLPAGGYLVIAFKADNPGSWLMHCHIAWHASSGLAIQFLERWSDVNRTFVEEPHRRENIKETERVCKTWRRWFNDRNNWYQWEEFQDDSGI